MENIGRIVAGFAGGVAVDEATRFLIKERPPEWATKVTEKQINLSRKDIKK